MTQGYKSPEINCEMCKGLFIPTKHKTLQRFCKNCGPIHYRERIRERYYENKLLVIRMQFFKRGVCE